MSRNRPQMGTSPQLPPPRTPAKGSFRVSSLLESELAPSAKPSHQKHDRRVFNTDPSHTKSHEQPIQKIERRYDLALALTGSSTPPTENTSIERPPIGSAAIRPSVKKKNKQAKPIDGLAEHAAKSLSVVQNPDGSCAFDIVIRDDVFDDLTCRVSVCDHRITATFEVHDSNLRRLLEAESPRLRASLDARGLVVDEIRVIDQ